MAGSTLSARHPEIAQDDVQRLLWAVEAGADWNRYDAGFRSRVAPLLSAGDIAMMSAKPVRDEIGYKPPPIWTAPPTKVDAATTGAGHRHQAN